MGSQSKAAMERCPYDYEIVAQGASPNAGSIMYGSSAYPVYSAWSGAPNCADTLFTAVCPDDPEPPEPPEPVYPDPPDIPPAPDIPDNPIGPSPPIPEPDDPEPGPGDPDDPSDNPGTTSYAGQLKWEWTWGGDDNTIDAYLNGSNVCTHHSKSHIIYYSISGTGGSVSGGGSTVTASCTGSWAPNGTEDSSPPGSVSITCTGTFFGVTHSKSGSNVLPVTVVIDLKNKTWSMR